MKNQFPKWIFRNRNGITVAFKNLRSVEGFFVAARVGPDGLLVFGKNGNLPNLHYMYKEDFSSLEDFKGKSGEEIRPIEAGCIGFNDNIWLADCMYEPGLIAEDLDELKQILLAFHHEYKSKLLA